MDDFGLGEFVVKDVQLGGKELGRGAYGYVEVVMVSGKRCAGKRVHEALLKDVQPAEREKMKAAFAKECRLHSSLEHENIVKFIGICFPPPPLPPPSASEQLGESWSADDAADDDSGGRSPPLIDLPVLLMELLSTCLDSYIDRNPSFPLPQKRAILRDVSSGLQFLHALSPPVVHRDLTARNVLLDGRLRAKIADLGVARVLGGVRQGSLLVSSLTTAPGNVVYMPPEALGMIPSYNETIDSFSFGVLTLYTLTQVFPVPDCPTRMEGGSLVPISEVDRRVHYIKTLHKQLGAEHPLVKMVLQCLDNAPEKRPTAKELHEVLTSPSEGGADGDSKLTGQELTKKLIELQSSNLQLKETVHQQNMRLRELEALMVQIKETVGTVAVENQTLKNQVKVLQESSSHRQEAFQRSHSECSAIESSTSTAGQSLTGKIRGRLSSVTKKIWSSGSHQAISFEEIGFEEAPIPRFILKWRQGMDCPFLCGNQAAVVSRHVCVVSTRGSRIAGYHSGKDTWVNFPTQELNVTTPAVVCLRNKLLVIGGMSSSLASGLAAASSKLSLWDAQQQKWTEPYEPMPTARSFCSAVVLEDDWLIVAGGWDMVKGKTQRYNVVEVLDINANKWYTSEPLPLKSCHEMSSAVLKGEWYLLGGYMERQPSRCVLSASLKELCAYAKMQKSLDSPSLSNKRMSLGRGANAKPTCWKVLCDIPFCHSTALSVRGHLVALGGLTVQGLQTKTVLMYEPKLQRWLDVGELPSARKECACVVVEDKGLVCIAAASGDGYTTTSRVRVDLTDVTDVQ